MQGGRGLWAVYYTSPQSFNIRWLNSFGDVNCILIDWFIKLSVQIFQPLIVIYKKGIFVYHQWGCTLIYRPFSYPFRSLKKWKKANYVDERRSNVNLINSSRLSYRKDRYFLAHCLKLIS